MNLFWLELKMNRKNIIIWTVALCLGIALFLALFPGFTKDIDTTRKIISNFPPAFRAALNISLDTFFGIYGFYMYVFSFLILAGCIFAMNLAVASVSKELHEKTADFLMSKPITRYQILSAKILSSLAAIIFVDLMFMVVAFLSAKSVTNAPFSNKIFLLLTITMPLIQLVFFSLGILISVTVPKIKSVIGYTLPTIFAFFIIGMLGSVLGDEAVRYITPFKFYDQAYIIQHGSYEARYLILESFIVVAAVLASYVVFSRKDIPSAT